MEILIKEHLVSVYLLSLISLYCSQGPAIKHPQTKLHFVCHRTSFTPMQKETPNFSSYNFRLQAGKRRF